MTLIGSKRLQQAMFEVAASSNRAAGSGGGNGVQVFQGNASVHGGNAVGNAGLAYSVAAYSLVQDGAGTP